MSAPNSVEPSTELARLEAAARAIPVRRIVRCIGCGRRFDAAIAPLSRVEPYTCALCLAEIPGARLAAIRAELERAESITRFPVRFSAGANPRPR